jgi:hypothetical protein
LPIIADPTPFEVCDDNIANGLTEMDLNIKNSEITIGNNNYSVQDDLFDQSNYTANNTTKNPTISNPTTFPSTKPTVEPSAKPSTKPSKAPSKKNL